MSNGLGAGFLALSLLATLGALALLTVLATVGAYGLYRQTGRLPALLRYLPAAVGVGVLGIAGFGILALVDDAPAVAGLLVAVVVAPLLAVSVYLDRTTALGRHDVVATTVRAWSVPFLPGVLVAFGVRSGLDATFDLGPGQGAVWVAAAAGGLAVFVAMVPLATSLGEVVRDATTTSERE